MSDDSARHRTPPVQLVHGTEPITRNELNQALAGLATREDIYNLASDLRALAVDAARRGEDARKRESRDSKRFDILESNHKHLDECLDKAREKVGVVTEQVMALRRTNDTWSKRIIGAVLTVGIALLLAHLGLK